MPIFSISDYRWAVSMLGCVSQLRTQGEIDARRWRRRFNLARFMISNMPNELLEAMIEVDEPVKWPEGMTIPIGPKDTFDPVSKILRTYDGYTIAVMGNNLISNSVDTVCFLEEISDDCKLKITLIGAIESVMNSQSYKDGYFYSGNLLSATWHIMNTIDRAEELGRQMPSPDDTIAGHFKVIPSQGDIQTFLSRFRSISGQTQTTPTS